jgi:hypothetical protein
LTKVWKKNISSYGFFIKIACRTARILNIKNIGPNAEELFDLIVAKGKFDDADKRI